VRQAAVRPVWTPYDGSGDPLDWLKSMIMHLYKVLQEYPGMAAYVIHYNRSVTENVSMPVHSILMDSGFSDEDASNVGIVLTLYIAGALLSDFENALLPTSTDPVTLVQAGLDFVLSSRRPEPSSRRTKAAKPTPSKSARTARAKTVGR
jgi:hypothetical protein